MSKRPLKGAKFKPPPSPRKARRGPTGDILIIPDIDAAFQAIIKKKHTAK